MKRRSRKPGKYHKLPDWTTRMIERTPVGIVALCFSGGEWHLPGGKRESADENPRDTGLRESKEEIGLPEKLGSDNIQKVCTRSSRQGKHNKYDVHYYTRTLTQAEVDLHLRAVGSEGEEVRVIPYRKLKKIQEFRESELRVLKMFKLLRHPGSRDKRTTQRA